MSFLSSSPGATDFPDVLGKYPRRSVLMLRLANEILREESAFSVAERELIFAYVSAQNACDYCRDSHRPVAAAFGIDESVFDELQQDVDGVGIDVTSEQARRTGATLLPTIGYSGIADEIEARAAAISAPSCAGSAR